MSYDQRYYRQWMHELPPLQHLDRGTSLDVHHTILPPTADSRIDARKLWEHIVDVPGFEGVHVLCRADMVLHSATHLFHEGEWENGSSRFSLESFRISRPVSLNARILPYAG